MAQSTELDMFLALSKILTGEEELDLTLANQYLQRLKEQYPTQMQALLNTFGDLAADPYATFEVKRRSIDNKDLQPLNQQVISIWYTSEFVGADKNAKPGTRDQYYSGLLWKVIGAHAPAHSRQPYGYWAERPSPKELRRRSHE